MQTQVHVSTHALAYCEHPRLSLDKNNYANTQRRKLGGKPDGAVLWTSSLNEDTSAWIYYCRSTYPRALHRYLTLDCPLADLWFIDVKPKAKIFDLDSPTKVKRFVHFFGNRPLPDVRSYVEIDWKRVRTAEYDGVRFSDDFDIDTDDDLHWLNTWTTESTVWFNPKVLYNYRKRSLTYALSWTIHILIIGFWCLAPALANRTMI